jgi:hypothetical protein
LANLLLVPSLVIALELRPLCSARVSRFFATTGLSATHLRPACPSRVAGLRLVVLRGWVSRVPAGLLHIHTVTTTPAFPHRALVVLLPVRSQPSLYLNQIGECIALFEAFSVFTHITVCMFSDSPKEPFPKVLERGCYLHRPFR